MRVECHAARLDALFAPLDSSDAPGVAVGVALDGEPLYRKAFGVASVELPVQLSPTTRMPIGSTTKHFTCLAYLLLCDDGKASLDDTVGRYLPTLHPRMQGVTVRQLMGHLSGLRDAAEMSMLFGGTQMAVALDEILALYRDIDDCNAAPGTAWIYNNGGYLLLSAIIERLAGQPLDEVLRQRIFEPAGMRDTLLRRFDTDLIPRSATLHLAGSDGRFRRGSRSIEGLGQGGIVSTVDDMLRWLACMDHPCVGSARSWQAIKTPLSLESGESTGYGLGLRTGHYRGVETLSHAGGVIGGNSQMIKLPQAGLDIVILANRDDVSALQLARQVIETCVVDLQPARVSAVRRPVEGVFYSKRTARVVELYVSAQNQAAAVNGMQVPASVEADGTLSLLPADGSSSQYIRFPCKETVPGSIRFNHFGYADELIAANPLRTAGLRAPAGRYRSQSIDIEAVISAEGSRLETVGRLGRAAYSLEPLAGNIWRAKLLDRLPLVAILLFRGDAFYFSTARTWKLTFIRQRA